MGIKQWTLIFVKITYYIYIFCFMAGFASLIAYVCGSHIQPSQSLPMVRVVIDLRLLRALQKVFRFFIRVCPLQLIFKYSKIEYITSHTI